MSLAHRFDLVIFDWAGTTVDFGCRAPVDALLEAFQRHGLSLTEPQIRRDMGKAKADHVRALLDDPAVAGAWIAATGAPASAADCDTGGPDRAAERRRGRDGRDAARRGPPDRLVDRLHA